MKDLVESLKQKMADFITDAEKVDNKSAARRARKLSMEIQTDLKTFRKESIK